MNYKFSDQALGAVMMALQKSLMEQTDIVPVLKGFRLQVDDIGYLIVTNPPIIKAPVPEEKKASPGIKITEKTYIGKNSKNTDAWDIT
jgi:hypothetical protein